MNFRNLFGWNAQPEPQQPQQNQQIIQLTEEDLINLHNAAQEQQQQEIVSQDDPLATLSFTLCASGDVNIHMDWVDTSDNTANLLGEMLYHVNSGDMKPHIVAILQEAAKQNPKNVIPFVRRIVKTWDKFMGSSRPLLKPSEALHKSVSPTVGRHDEDD